MEQRTLADLSPGQRGTIQSANSRSGAVQRRLADMGLTPGTLVEVARIAPLGDPIEVTLRGYALSLRREDAARIVLGQPQRVGAARAAVTRHVPRRPPPVRRGNPEPLTCIALAGNPNCGKTTLFNALTGANQYVGNWPGVTVEKKEGLLHMGERMVTVVDLPGLYSLSPYSLEERAARDFLLGQNPGCVIDIVDATNLERNLYLTLQLLELKQPTVMALNFMDEVDKRGDAIDVDQLSRQLGIPVVPITARTGEGLDALLHAADQQARLGAGEMPPELQDQLDALRTGYGSASAPEEQEALAAGIRYQYIERTAAAVLVKGASSPGKSLSASIDRVVTHRIWAIPLFLCAMLVMFTVTFGPFGSWLSGLAAAGMDSFSQLLARALEAWNVSPVLISLVCGGILAGVGSVLTFLPQIALLFFFLSFLEDSGYMARAAFLMDRLLRRFGLSGKAFIPMLMGFGCSVPAILGARTMEHEKDRRLTILLVPFLSCSAKLPVYGLISAAFFGPWAGLVVFGLYLTGMAAGILSGLFFQKFLFAGEPAPFVLELPPYRLPSAANMLTHVWQKLKGFLQKAGSLILLLSIVLWVLQSFDFSLHLVQDPARSILGVAGGWAAPVFAPCGFGQWQVAVALLSGLAAKEMIVSSLAMFYGFSLTASGSTVAAAMSGFTPLSALALLVFVLLYVPCAAAVATLFQELDRRWAWFSIAWQLGWAYTASLLVYQLGRLFLA